MKIQMIAFTEKGYRLAEQLRMRWITAPATLDAANAVDQDASRAAARGLQDAWPAAQSPRIELHAKTEALPAISDPRSLHDIVAEWFTKSEGDMDRTSVSLSVSEEESDVCVPGAGGPEHGLESEKSAACEMGEMARDAGTRHPCDAIIFVGATGIAVRAIAPFITGKAVDPAVLVIDEAGRYVISLLSGHLGGANALAHTAASLIEAEPIITTATDAESAFAVDTFAKENGFLLTDLRKAKEVSAKVLRGEKLRIYSDIPMELLVQRPARHEAELVPAQEIDRADIIISYRAKLLNQATGLRLIAKRVHVGLGARKGVTQAEVAAAVATCLEDTGIDPRAVVDLVSIDLKKQEAGILAYSYESGVPFVTYTAEELRTVEGAFAGSSFVQSVTGVANVCERAAAFAAGRSGHAEVLVHKTIHGNVTTAVAVEA